MSSEGARMIKEVSKLIGLVLWFVMQRVTELLLLAATLGSFCIYRSYIGPLVPPEMQPVFQPDILFRYVVPYAHVVFGFVIVVQISVIVWISRMPPRPPPNNVPWWV